MAEITLSGQLPAENGLVPLVKELLDTPRRGRLIVGIVDVSWSKTNHDKQQTYPVVRFRHIEAVSDKNLKAASKVLGDELARRTGQDMLPFPPGEDIPLDFTADDEWADDADATVTNIRPDLDVQDSQ